MTEDDLEQACIEWLKGLGWSYAHGETISPGGEHSEREHYTHVVLAGRLNSAISRFNPELPTDAVETVVAKLLNYAGQSLVEANREIYVWLRDGVPVEVEIDGHRRIVTAQVFDFDDADSNDWLIVNQYTVKGSKTCRPDLVAFVNGIPLGVIELKNPADEDTDVTAAFHQIQNYKSEIQQLFEPNLCCVISDGAVARVGSITADEERFMPWRVAEGIEHPEEHLELEVLIRGLFDLPTFLSYFRYFVAFQNTGSGAAKMIAGYHQYHGVQKAAQRAVEAATQTNDGKGGVMWFTQGSGKSLIALFYVCLLREHPELKNPTIVVVTDRNDLDGQLFETFAASETTLRTAPTQAQDVPELKKLLSSQPAGGVFFTTIQKFQPSEPGKPMEMLCDRSNVIVICDEAHRTQYGFKAKLDSKTGQMKYGLAKHMREALPNAVYLGLTGTPISGDDKDTQAVFGDYVDIYDVLASQRDGTTVPIHYESRIIDLAVNQDELEQLDDDLDELLDSEDDSVKGQAASRLARLESIAMADGRLEKLAKDLVQHWQSRLEVIDGKAMIVAMSRAAAVALYDEIIKVMPDWHNDDLDQGFIKVVMTSPSSDPPAMRKHATSPTQKKQLEKRIKDPDDPLKLVIVRDMWLTGFDAPCLHTLYVDKPMRGAGLMQAVARVNRVWKDKPGGLVVDYIGIGEELKAAISEYTKVTGEKRGRPVDFVDSVVVQLKDRMSAIRDLLHDVDLSGHENPATALALLPKAMNSILKQDKEYLEKPPEPKDGKKKVTKAELREYESNRPLKRYLDLVLAATKAQALAGTHPDALVFREEIAFHQAVRAGLVKHTLAGKKLTKTEREAAMRQIVAKSVLVQGVTDLYKTLGVEKPDISVLDERFLAEVAKLPTKNLAAELLQRLINDEIKARSKKNTTQAHKFSDKLVTAVNKYRNRGLTTAQVIEQLIQIAKEMAEDRPPDDMGDDEFAFYEALRENESAVREMGDPTLKALAIELTDKLRKSATIDWQKRESARAKMRIVVKLLLTRYKYPPDKQPEALDKVIEQAELYADQWGVERP